MTEPKITREQVERLTAERAGQPMVVKINKEEDDPAGVLRASVGGLPGLGYYLIFRGDSLAVQAMLRDVLAAFEGTNDA